MATAEIKWATSPIFLQFDWFSDYSCDLSQNRMGHYFFFMPYFGNFIALYDNFVVNDVIVVVDHPTFIIIVEFPNILYWKPEKKFKLGVVLGQNLGQIMSNNMKKVKKRQAIALGFFRILLGEYLLKQKIVVVKLPEWKFMAIVARNAKF